MFTNEFKERKQDEIVLQDIHGVDLKIIIDAIYTSKIEMTEENVYDILRTSMHLQLAEIESQCSTYLMQNIKISNCLTIWTSVVVFPNLDAIVQLAFKFAEENFTDVVETHQFLLLDANDLFTLLNSDNLDVWSEEEVFNGLIKWLNYEKATRGSEIPKLLATIRFTHLKPKVTEKINFVFYKKPNNSIFLYSFYTRKLNRFVLNSIEWI